MQFLNLLRGHDMTGFIDGSEACPPRNLSTGSLNPAYDVWQKKDVCLLGWILASISERLVSTIYGLNTSKQVWTTLQNRFSSQSRSRISHLKRQLQMLTQGGKTCSAYLDSAKTLVDQLAAAGKPVDDQDLINFLLIGLHSSYTPFVTSFNFASRDTEFTFEDFQTELLGFENLLEITQSAATSDTSHFAFASHIQSPPPISASASSHPPSNPETSLSYIAPIPPKTSPSYIAPIPVTHTDQPVVPTIQTRSKIGHSRPKQYSDYQLFYSTRHPLRAFSAFHAIVEPTCYTKATLDSQWRAVMGREFDALMENGTWSLCPRPLNKHVVRNKWIYKGAVRSSETLGEQQQNDMQLDMQQQYLGGYAVQ
ncbi:hypothetical protein POTOM_001009 [Populus tomentosa]|uniref:Uncharacterized protein n=1 Tax=Populus tomentosa TaxID=118781 RepID=A0A8X8DH43_POPTO|nr:hypothetical protein POTOM_001009 [Populus tomentosa]